MSDTQNTGQFAKVIVTNAGKDMIAKSQNGQVLRFTRVALGDGLIVDGEDPVKFNTVKNERVSCPIAKFTNLGNGQFEVQFRLSNQQVDAGFWHREIGVMAQIDNGTELLYAYTTAGNKASYIYDKTTPVEERVVNIDFVVGNADNIEVVINNSVIYVTQKDFEAHNADASAHSAAIAKHDNATGAHKANLATKAEAEEGSNNSKFMTPARTNDAISKNLDEFLVGMIFPYAGKDIPAGFLLCNGAAISRTTYARLFAKIGTLYGTGDGSTTFNLPNLIERFVEGGDSSTAGSYLDAAIPNIKGAHSWLAIPTPSAQQAMFIANTYPHVSAIQFNDVDYNRYDLGFDASRCSNVYSDNCNTVQVASVTCQYLIKY